MTKNHNKVNHTNIYFQNVELHKLKKKCPNIIFLRHYSKGCSRVLSPTYPTVASPSAPRTPFRQREKGVPDGHVSKQRARKRRTLFRAVPIHIYLPWPWWQSIRVPCCVPGPRTPPFPFPRKKKTLHPRGV